MRDKMPIRHKIETTKLALWSFQLFLDILIGLLFYGWLHGSGDISQPFNTVLVVKAIIYLGYFFKSCVENKSKGNLEISKVQNIKLNDVLTLLSGVLSSMNSYNGSDAINNIIQSIQTIVSNHDTDNMPQVDNIQPQMIPNDDSHSSNMSGNAPDDSIDLTDVQDKGVG